MLLFPFHDNLVSLMEEFESVGDSVGRAFHLQHHRAVLNLHEQHINIYCIKALRFQVYFVTEAYSEQ